MLANETHAKPSAINEVADIHNVGEFLDMLNSSMAEDQEPTKYEIARREFQSRYDDKKETESQLSKYSENTNIPEI